MIRRRDLLAAGAGLSLAGGRIAKADGAPLTKAAVGYQDVPRDGKVCAQCVYFVFKPASAGVTTPQSRCKMVAGPINPAGWCEIWAPGGGSGINSSG